ncbi:hypothetical protein ACFLXN_00330 [Chloroflexota bacterium]
MKGKNGLIELTPDVYAVITSIIPPEDGGIGNVPLRPDGGYLFIDTIETE